MCSSENHILALGTNNNLELGKMWDSLKAIFLFRLEGFRHVRWWLEFGFWLSVLRSNNDYLPFGLKLQFIYVLYCTLVFIIKSAVKYWKNRLAGKVPSYFHRRSKQEFQFGAEGHFFARFSGSSERNRTFTQMPELPKWLLASSAF